MLRIHTSRNSAAAKQYYTQGLTTGDYYTRKGQEVGMWGGKAAAMLGLSGDVAQQDFFRLADNLHPQTGQQLTPRMTEGRRVGYDFTFNAPKSLSIAYGLGDCDTKHMIKTLFEQSVSHTMQLIEQQMQVRVRAKGANHDRTTGNMVWASFTHDTSRPNDHGFADMHLHTHAFAMNVTHDPDTGWKAGQFGEIKRNSNYYEAVFHNHLATAIQQQGYAITPTKDRWELSGISRELIEEFSQRTAQIEAIAKEQNITNIGLKSSLAATSRNTKDITRSWEEIQANWQERYVHHASTPIENLKHAHPIHSVEAQHAVDHALKHVFERQSVARENYVIQAALRFGVGAVNVREVRDILHKNTLQKQVGNEVHVTTPEVLQEEISIIKCIRSGRGTQAPLGPDQITIKNDVLNPQQRDVITNILQSSDQIMAIIGRAGVGKTTVLKEIKANIEASGKQLFAFAPSSDAAHNVLRSEGFGRAETIARLLVDPKLHRQIHGQVIVIDEAGMVGTKILNQLLERATKEKARVILSGDPKQHGSVERGDGLRMLEVNSGMQSFYLDTIVRQKRTLFKQAVEAISQGKLDQSLEALDRMSAFVEIDEPSERYTKIAEDYMAALLKKESVLVVSPTHHEGDEITAAIRDRLRVAGTIRKQEITKTTLRNLSFTDAEKSNAVSYAPGQVIQFTQNAKGFTRGEQFTVLGVGENTSLIAQNHSGEQVALPLQHHGRFEVYQQREILLSPGDYIRITQNGGTKYNHHRLRNGSHYHVKQIKKNGDVILNNGWLLDQNFAHIKHGYVATSHASQGKTVDRILIGQSSESFGRASTLEQFYVSLSRGKHDVSIYTDNKDELKQQLSKSNTRMSATELMRPAIPKRSLFSAAKMAVRRYQNTRIQQPKAPNSPTIQPNISD